MLSDIGGCVGTHRGVHINDVAWIFWLNELQHVTHLKFIALLITWRNRFSFSRDIEKKKKLFFHFATFFFCLHVFKSTLPTSRSFIHSSCPSSECEAKSPEETRREMCCCSLPHRSFLGQLLRSLFPACVIVVVVFCIFLFMLIDVLTIWCCGIPNKNVWSLCAVIVGRHIMMINIKTLSSTFALSFVIEKCRNSKELKTEVNT